MEKIKKDLAKTSHASDKQFHYRCLAGKILHIGIRKHFDRWANSVDFVCRCPSDAKGFEALFLALDDCIKKERFTKGWGQELDIDFLIRKAKRGKIKD